MLIGLVGSHNTIIARKITSQSTAPKQNMYCKGCSQKVLMQYNLCLIFNVISIEKGEKENIYMRKETDLTSKSHE